MREVIQRKHLYFFLAAILGIALAIIVSAWGTSNPQNFGHSIKELGVHPSDGCAAGQVLQVGTGGTTVVCGAVTGGGGGWTDGGASVYLTTSTDNVGIGTSSPQTKLHVKGTNNIINIEGTNNAFINWYPSGFSNGAKAWIGFEIPSQFAISTEDDNLDILLLPGSRRVGIGTRNPEELLTLKGSDAILQIYRTGIGAGQEPAIVFKRDSGAGAQIRGLESGGLRITDGGVANTWMTINNNGNVGIGTTNPQAKLDVNGNANINGDIILDRTSGVVQLLYKQGQGSINRFSTFVSATGNWGLARYDDAGNIISPFPISVNRASGNVEVNTRLVLPQDTCVVKFADFSGAGDNTIELCAANEVLTGGGVHCGGSATNSIRMSRPYASYGVETRSWTAGCVQTGSHSVYAICCKFKQL